MHTAYYLITKKAKYIFLKENIYKNQSYLKKNNDRNQIIKTLFDSY